MSGNPFLRIVRGDPDEAELAALVAVFAALAAGARPEAERESIWADPAWRHGEPPPPGPDGWRGSGLPR
ncbi:acyl-CoA carboxylase epsilon subunit [Amycolatopsis nigrescens]|uniref:acyl-CoA carboxylase epsilon subunit n=1 Tax=Amycolatopsis nigrescens TaxID=381445 RepID=UPI00037F57FB|nr:acyl-CoA carboxylase epsilon subunit [Amycolatopsis nigrescens]